MTSQREQFRSFLARGDLEGALSVVEAALPGRPGGSTRINNLSGARNLLRWAQDEWRSVLHPDLRLRGGLPESFGRKVRRGDLQHPQPPEPRPQPLPRPRPVRGLRPGSLSGAARHRTVYTVAEVARLAGAGEVVARALVLCGTHRGLRGPEVLRLAWTDVDFAGDTMRVAERDVPLSAALDGALRAHANSSGPGALVPEVGRVFALGSASELRGVLFARCRAAGVWYGGRAWRALRAHAGVRFWDECGAGRRGAGPQGGGAHALYRPQPRQAGRGAGGRGSARCWGQVRRSTSGGVLIGAAGGGRFPESVRGRAVKLAQAHARLASTVTAAKLRQTKA